MIDSKRRLINEEDEEMDDKFEMVTVLLIGQYQKRMQIAVLVQLLVMRFIIGKGKIMT
jgi:hypothetical protein